MAIRTNTNATSWVDGIREYIEEQKKLPPEQARKEAFEDLYAAGVIHENGKAKDNIVSWA